MLDVTRKTCNAGSMNTFTLEGKYVSFAVKNFSDKPVYVSLGVWDESKSIRVNANICETVISSRTIDSKGMPTGERPRYNTVCVKSVGSGEVEIIGLD